MTSRSALKHALLIPVPMLLLMSLAGCKCAEKMASSDNGVPADLKITFGREGTFGGRSMGYSITGDGQVIQWEGRYPEERTEATASIDTAHVRTLWEHAEAIGFLNLRDQAMATVSSFITLSAGGESRRVTWTARDENALTPAQEFFDACMEVATNALEEGDVNESDG